ncbi:DUF3047 domain-containing protein [Candidatus Omnitrophota bacterium]
MLGKDFRCILKVTSLDSKRLRFSVTFFFVIIAFLYSCVFICAENSSGTIFDLSKTLDNNFSENWQQIIPKKQKAYTNYLVEHEEGRTSLMMSSGGTGSWIEKDLGEIDVREYPRMEWSWMVKQFPDVDWEQEKSDDDFAIRIELVFDYKGSVFNILNMFKRGLYRTVFKHGKPELIISYVWARRVPAEKTYTSPEDSRLIVFPVESGLGRPGLWMDESRDISKDLISLAQEKRYVLKKIRIRADTDNSLSNAESGLQKLIIRTAGKDEN